MIRKTNDYLLRFLRWFAVLLIGTAIFRWAQNIVGDVNTLFIIIFSLMMATRNAGFITTSHEEEN